MIQVYRHDKSPYSSDVKATTIGFRKDRRISSWQTGVQSHSTKIVSPAIGNRSSRWLEIASSSISLHTINAENIRKYCGIKAISFGPNDPLEAINQMGINIPQLEAVRTYLHQHPDLFRLLAYVSKISRDDFEPPQAQLSLEVYRDIETNEEYLTLYVRQSKYDPNIMKKIKQIRRKYRELTKDIKGRFLLTTDFQSPG